MDNKTLVIDNQVAVFGGRNMGSEYFLADPHLTFGDLAAVGIGPVAQELSNVFDLYWNSELVYPISVLIDRPPTEDEIAHGRKAMEDYVADQVGADYVKALHHSDLAKN
jgi:cardiolipin synthase C